MSRGSSDSTRAAIDRDAADLQRGVGINLLGHALKLADPVLLVLVTTAYGIERFGAFTVAQAMMLLAVRVGALGLDKGLLWWVARQPPERRRTHVRGATALAAALTAVVALVVIVGADPDLLERLGQPRAIPLPLRIVALAMVPQVCADVLTHAAMGLRRMEAQVLVKDAVLPITFPVAALALYHGLGLADLGLPIAYVIASAVALVAAAWMHRRLFMALPRSRGIGVMPPRALVRYAVPLWLAEMSNSLLQRIDVVLVEVLTGDLHLVGAYGVATRFSNAIRQIRRSFDPVVVAIVSEIGARGSPHRLRAGLSYAAFLVTLTQLPIFAALFAYTEDVTPLFGDGFEIATTPIVILGGVWLVAGTLGLAGIVVTAYGHSTQTLLATLFAIVLLAVSGVILIPQHRLVGAALAVGIGYVGQGLLQVAQMRWITGAWNYDRSVLRPLALGAAAGVAMALAWLLAGAVVPRFAAKSLGVLVFALVYGAGVVRLARAGLLRRGSR